MSENQDAPNSILDKIANHLEFLGYEIEQEVEEDGKAEFRALHPKFYNIFVRELGFGVILMAYLNANDDGKMQPDKVYRCVNAFNQSARVARGYMDKDFDFVMEAWFPSHYDKVTFGRFMESYNADTRLIFDEMVQMELYLK